MQASKEAVDAFRLVHFGKVSEIADGLTLAYAVDVQPMIKALEGVRDWYEVHGETYGDYNMTLRNDRHWQPVLAKVRAALATTPKLEVGYEGAMSDDR